MATFQKPARLQAGDTVAVLPLGVLAEIDCESRTFRLVEACVR